MKCVIMNYGEAYKPINLDQKNEQSDRLMFARKKNRIKLTIIFYVKSYQKKLFFF